MGMSANVMSLKAERALTSRRKRKTPTDKALSPERFEKNINLEEKARNFNFNNDAEDETRKAASTIERNLFPLSTDGGFQDSVDRLKTDDSCEMRQNTTDADEVFTKRENKAKSTENIVDQEQDTARNAIETHQDLIQKSPKTPKTPISPTKVDQPDNEKIGRRAETSNFEDEWNLIESQDLVNIQDKIENNKGIDE